MTVAIAHKQGERCIIDVVRGRAAPFDPDQVAQEFAALAKEYGCFSVQGDCYSGEWVSQRRDATSIK